MTPSALKKKDISLLNKTLFDLAKPRLLLRLFVVALACALWLWIAQWLLNFGARQDYAFLNQFSTQIVTFLNSINKYIWWGVILIGNLILYFMLYSWISGSIERAGSIVPKQEVIERLINGLSQDGKNVLAWVWQDQREPITIRVLDETRDQLKGPRVQRLAQVEQQRHLLGLAEVGNQSIARSTLAPITAATAVAAAGAAAYNTPEPSAISQESPEESRAKVDAMLADVSLKLDIDESVDLESVLVNEEPLDLSIQGQAQSSKPAPATQDIPTLNPFLESAPEVGEPEIAEQIEKLEPGKKSDQ